MEAYIWPKMAIIKTTSYSKEPARGLLAKWNYFAKILSVVSMMFFSKSYFFLWQYDGCDMQHIVHAAWISENIEIFNTV